MRTREKERLLRRLAAEFRSARHFPTNINGPQRMEGCAVWYKDGESRNGSGYLIGIDSSVDTDRTYEGAQRYLVRWDEKTRLPTTEVVDNSIKNDCCLVSHIYHAVSEVLEYIRHSEQMRERNPEAMASAIRQFGEKLTTGPNARKKCRRFLQDAGITGKDGKLTKPYRRATA